MNESYLILSFIVKQVYPLAGVYLKSFFSPNLFSLYMRCTVNKVKKEYLCYASNSDLSWFD